MGRGRIDWPYFWQDGVPYDEYVLALVIADAGRAEQLVSGLMSKRGHSTTKFEATVWAEARIDQEMKRFFDQGCQRGPSKILRRGWQYRGASWEGFGHDDTE